MSIFDKLNEKRAKEFYAGIDGTPYNYSDRILASHIKNKDRLVADNAEIIGRALAAEMKKTGKPLSSKM